MSKTNSCEDCKLACDKRSKRCILCANKLGGKRIRNPKYCKRCNAELTKKKYEFCQSCNMKLRWSDQEYKIKTTNVMRKVFDEKWSDPAIRAKIVKNITTYTGSSKLERKVSSIGKLFNFESSVVIGRYLADLLNEETKTIVEINGDLWHCNPKFWKAEDIHPNKKVTAQTIWDSDQKRRLYLENLGYKVFVIWEHDINHGKDKFIKEFFIKISDESNVESQKQNLT